MKKILTYTFILLYLTAMVKPVLPVLEYVLNQDYIAEVLCINKDKPMLNCDGKCYLAQMIKEQQEKDHQDIPSADLREYPIGFVNILDVNFESVLIKTALVSMHTNLNEQQFISTVFRPPNFIS